MTRKRLFEIIERSNSEDRIGTWYDIFMVAVIVLSLIPLAFKAEPAAFLVMDRIAAVIFILDYLARWVTADYKFGSSSPWSFVRYPFTFMAIIDLLSILPSISIVNKGFKLLRLLRMFRTMRVLRAMRVLRVAKALRYSKNFDIILQVIRDSRRPLGAVVNLAIGYILVAALVIFNVEPETFDTFFDAVYWATVSLTTVGYGDIYPVSVMGRIITMISSVLGIAVVALPAGIITAGFMKRLDE